MNASATDLLYCDIEDDPRWGDGNGLWVRPLIDGIVWLGAIV